MIAQINKGSNLYGALSYNQEKMDTGLGKILETNRIFVPANGQFHVSDCMRDFERAMPVQVSTSRPVIHISLNPHPEDVLTDAQLTDIGREYIERMGFGDQPYMIFKHEDIGREHIHIVSSRVRSDGSIISDKKDWERSQKITDDLEKKYGLHPKGKGQEEIWQLSPVDAEAGNLKKQVANVIKPLASMYRFGSLSEYRALLCLYNIGVEEIKGEHKGKPYEGLVYSVLDKDGERIGKPLKSSLFGKTVGLEGLKTRYEASQGAVKIDGSIARTRLVVGESLAASHDEKGFREALRNKGIDMVLRRNDQGRLYGVTFIDHNSRTVLNGSTLGKDFSANRMAQRWADLSQGENRREAMNPVPSTPLKDRLPKDERAVQDDDQKPIAKTNSEDGSSGGSILSILTPETDQYDHNQPLFKRKNKRRRKYGRQM